MDKHLSLGKGNAHHGTTPDTKLTLPFSLIVNGDHQQLETQRRLHEEIDRLEQAVVDQFMLNPKTVCFYIPFCVSSNWYQRLDIIFCEEV